MVFELDGGVGSAHNVNLTVIMTDHGTHTLILCRQEVGVCQTGDR